MATIRVNYKITEARPNAFFEGYLESRGYRPTRSNVSRLRRALEAGAYALIDVNIDCRDGDLWVGIHEIFPDLSETPDFED